jgi:hypothetical protein
MWVKVRFPDYYREYSYKYDLAQKPRKGDYFIVNAPSGFRLVKCTKVLGGEAPLIATKHILMRFSSKVLTRISNKKD